MTNEKIKENIIIVILAILCLGTSFCLMAIGYRDFLPNPKWLTAGVAALIVVILLGFLSYKITEARRRDERLEKIAVYFGCYLVLTIFSFFGNFNTIFPRFMGTELLRTELREKQDAINKFQEDAKLKLGSQENLKPQVDSLVGQLEVQIRNQADPGCGPECDKILVKIEKLLDATITRLRGGNKEALIRDYKKIIASEYETYMAKNNDAKRKDLSIQLDKTFNDLKPKINIAIENPNETGVSTLKEMVEKYKEYGNRTQQLIGENFKYDNQMRIQNEEIGKIGHTLSSALEHTNHWGTWVSVLLSLLFDLLVPVMIMILITPNSKNKYENDGGPAEL